jgi:hypothetical protein
MLLNRLDPEAAEDAWDRLSSDESIVEASHGYLRTRTMVAELVAALRAASPEMAFTEEEYKEQTISRRSGGPEPRLV